MTKPTLVEGGPPPDPFDLASLRLNSSFLETAGAKKLLTTIPAQKPNPQDFVRVHPSPDYSSDFFMVDLKDDREDFLVRPEIYADLSGEDVAKTIFTAINRQGVLFLWPIRLPTPDESRKMEWPRSAREAAEMAVDRWVRLKANISLGAYEITVADGIMADPIWPDLTFQQLLKIAYRDE